MYSQTGQINSEVHNHGGRVRRGCCWLFDLFAYTLGKATRQPCFFASRPKPARGVYIWGPHQLRRFLYLYSGSGAGEDQAGVGAGCPWRVQVTAVAVARGTIMLDVWGRSQSVPIDPSRGTGGTIVGYGAC